MTPHFEASHNGRFFPGVFQFRKKPPEALSDQDLMIRNQFLLLLPTEKRKNAKQIRFLNPFAV
jgi:hypothetical protein